jgi:N-acetylornithine carbamoyltransferase
MEVVVLRPDEYALPEPLMARARAAAERSGGRVVETADRAEALAGAHILYGKSWSSPVHYGRPEEEKKIREGLVDWTIDSDWFDRADPACRFFHCLPVRRNVVVTDAVLDSPRSAVVPQAHNRLWAQMAVLHRMLASPASAAASAPASVTASAPTSGDWP